MWEKRKIGSMQGFSGHAGYFLLFVYYSEGGGGGRTPLADRRHVPPKKSIYYTPLLRL